MGNVPLGRKKAAGKFVRLNFRLVEGVNSAEFIALIDELDAMNSPDAPMERSVRLESAVKAGLVVKKSATINNKARLANLR